MQKEFDLKTFKKAASNVSGFLKDKNVEVQQVTLYNALSLFLGHKNWNTLKAKLEEDCQTPVVAQSITDNEKDVLNFNYRVNEFIIFMQQESPSYVGRYCDYHSVLATAQKIASENTENFNLTQHDNKRMCNTRFSKGISMGDEKTYSIKIAQKGEGWFSFLDVVVFIYMVDNKWFENYVMGEGRYSYHYDSDCEKQVINLLLPIDNFMLDGFGKELENLEKFITIFADNMAKVRVDVDKFFDDKGYNSVNIMTNSFSNSAGSAVAMSGSGSGRSKLVNNNIKNAGRY